MIAPPSGAPFYITAATLDDARAIAQIHVLSWQHAYLGILPDGLLASLSVAKRENLWREYIVSDSPEILIIKSADEACGFISFGATRDAEAPRDTAEIIALYVAPHVWATGMGCRLWLAALERLKTQAYTAVSLWVLTDNARAVRFYELAGFEVQPDSRKQITIGSATLDEIRYVRHIDDCAFS